MKISASVRALYEQLRLRHDTLKEAVDSLVLSRKERRWHYESRVKAEQSFALKLEPGREVRPTEPKDFFACVLVVENQTRIQIAEEFVDRLFCVDARRPLNREVTPLQPHSFDFDDVRLYVSWQDDPAQRPTGLNGLTFEFQIKTFLQHAWSIATHDLVYKTDAVNWATSRIAYQVKAALENAELSIAEARQLSESVMLNKADRASVDLQKLIDEVQHRWPPELLPTDLRRLAQNISDVSHLLKISLPDLWECLDAATSAGAGTQTLNLSPHGAIISALLQRHGANTFQKLVSSKKKVFVPLEIELPLLPDNVMKQIIRPLLSD